VDFGTTIAEGHFLAFPPCISVTQRIKWDDNRTMPVLQRIFCLLHWETVEKTADSILTGENWQFLGSGSLGIKLGKK
jgi:hypothetical protein